MNLYIAKNTHFPLECDARCVLLAAGPTKRCHETFFNRNDDTMKWLFLEFKPLGQKTITRILLNILKTRYLVK